MMTRTVVEVMDIARLKGIQKIIIALTKKPNNRLMFI